MGRRAYGQNWNICRAFSTEVFVTPHFSGWLWAQFLPYLCQRRSFSFAFGLAHIELAFLLCTFFYLSGCSKLKDVWIYFNFFFLCAEMCVNWPRTQLNLEIIAHVGQYEPKHEGMTSSCQVLGWHFVNYICYFIGLMLMPWQCPDTLGYTFLLNLQPKVLPSDMDQGWSFFGHLD